VMDIIIHDFVFSIFSVSFLRFEVFIFLCHTNAYIVLRL
jgi:hypothetical protein